VDSTFGPRETFSVYDDGWVRGSDKNWYKSNTESWQCGFIFCNDIYKIEDCTEFPIDYDQFPTWNFFIRCSQCPYMIEIPLHFVDEINEMRQDGKNQDNLT